MSLLLAPYNSAMRLGMGFNSFTQQLCIDNAVQLASGTPSSEKNLQVKRPKYDKGLMTGEEGVENVSQVVTWTAKFVDRISEVTDSLNIGGSLQIKADAIGGGAGAHFVDSNKFKESDINYFIQVKVTNEVLVAPDVTEFSPIENGQTSDFTSIYGDSFISGFLEGGEFNALVSIKLTDRSKAKEVGAELKVNLDLKAASGELRAQGSSKALESQYQGETTITVSWTGGGDIKDESITDWTLETLKKVAMEFPEHVMACPKRTNAILTKYTSLKSFHEKQLKGSPLDYENAGVYSSALLDAYMDYKVMWRNIQNAAWEVEQHQSELIAKPSIPELATMAREAQSNYSIELGRYREALNAPGEEPLPPVELVPYVPDIFGLDKARRDCRFEMIKIVREVDAVAQDPKVASDPHRSWRYLSPAVFRMLLPTVVNLDQKKAIEDAKRAAADAQEELTKAKTSLTKADATAKAQQEELTNTKRLLAETQEKVKSLDIYNNYCPAPLDKTVLFTNVSNNMRLDHGGSPTINNLYTWNLINDKHDPHRFVILRAGPIGFFIRAAGSTDRFVAIEKRASEDRFNVGVRKVGSVFTFEPKPDGTTIIRLANQNHIINVDKPITSNGAAAFLSSNSAGDADRWSVKVVE